MSTQLNPRTAEPAFLIVPIDVDATSADAYTRGDLEPRTAADRLTEAVTNYRWAIFAMLFTSALCAGCLCALMCHPGEFGWVVAVALTFALLTWTVAGMYSAGVLLRRAGGGK